MGKLVEGGRSSPEAHCGTLRVSPSLKSRPLCWAHLARDTPNGTHTRLYGGLHAIRGDPRQPSGNVPMTSGTTTR